LLDINVNDILEFDTHNLTDTLKQIVAKLRGLEEQTHKVQFDLLDHEVKFNGIECTMKDNRFDPLQMQVLKGMITDKMAEDISNDNVEFQIKKMNADLKDFKKTINHRMDILSTKVIEFVDQLANLDKFKDAKEMGDKLAELIDSHTSVETNFGMLKTKLQDLNNKFDNNDKDLEYKFVTNKEITNLYDKLTFLHKQHDQKIKDDLKKDKEDATWKSDFTKKVEDGIKQLNSKMLEVDDTSG